MKPLEENLKDLESLIVDILFDKLSQSLDKFILPIRMQELQKEIQLRMAVSSPPLFILAKQIGENCTLETIFFKVLEERGRVREILITELMSLKYKD